MNLSKGNIFKKRSVLLTLMVCACKFWKSSGENLLTVDHNEVEFVQRGREVVRREPQSVKEVVNRIIVRCEDEQLGAFLVAANLSSDIVRQSSSHSDDSTDIIWTKFVAPSGQAEKPSGGGDTLNSGRRHLGCPPGVWSPVGPGEGLRNDQKLRFVQRRVVNGGNAWPPG